MNLEQIKEIIANYDKLYNLAISKIDVLSSLDRQYNTGYFIETILFEDDFVFVKCDDTNCGCYDYLSFKFPISWLTKTDAELEEIVIAEKKLKEERELEEKNRKELENKKAKEEQELKEYLRLKEKFEQNG